jgi:hypothetical protein
MSKVLTREHVTKNLFGVFDKICLSLNKNIDIMKNQLTTNAILYPKYADNIQQLTIENIFLPIMRLNEDPEPSLHFTLKFFNVITSNYLQFDSIHEIIDFLQETTSISTHLYIHAYTASLVCKFQFFLLSALSQILPNLGTKTRNFCFVAFYLPNVTSKMEDKRKHAIQILTTYQRELSPDFRYQRPHFLSDRVQCMATRDSRNPIVVFISSFLSLLLQNADREWLELQNMKMTIKYLRAAKRVCQGDLKGVLKHHSGMFKSVTIPSLMLTHEESCFCIHIVSRFCRVATQVNEPKLSRLTQQCFERIYPFCEIDVKYNSMKFYCKLATKREYPSSMIRFLTSDLVFMVHSPISNWKVVESVISDSIHKFQALWTKYCIQLRCLAGEKYSYKLNFVISCFCPHINDDNIKAILVFLLSLPDLYERLSDSTKSILKFH